MNLIIMLSVRTSETFLENLAKIVAVKKFLRSEFFAVVFSSFVLMEMILGYEFAEAPSFWPVNFVLQIF